MSDAVKAKKRWNWAGTGPTDSLSIGAAFTCEALALDCRIVAGYKGSADAGLAVMRGEMDAAFVAESSANNFVRSGQNWALATMSREAVAVLQGSPDHLPGGPDERGARPG